MNAPLILRAGTYNLRNGGLDGPRRDDTRLLRQIDMLRDLKLDVLGLQEAKWGTRSRSRLEHVADQLGMTWRNLVPSNFHGCDLAVLVRESNQMKVTQTRHLTGPPFVHAHSDVELRINGRDRPIRFMVGHLAPSSAGIRADEAELVGVYRGLDVVYVADCNAVGVGENPDTTGVDPYHAAGKLDVRAAEALQAAGFVDVGAYVGNTTPTVGHTRAGRLAYRCDRIYTTLPTDTIIGYGVVQEAGEPLSDHRPVWADFAFP